MSGRPIILRGRPVIGGIAEGEALVSAETLSGWGGVDPRTGTIIETRHPLRGVDAAVEPPVRLEPGAAWSGRQVLSA